MAANELPYTVAWTRTALSDGSGRHQVAWTVTDNNAVVVFVSQKIYNPTDPEALVSRDIRNSLQQARFLNVQVQDMPASGSFTSTVGELSWPSPLP